MALTPIQKSVIQEMQVLAEMAIQFKTRARNIVEMYANENINTVADVDLQAFPQFAHMTAAELQGAKGGLDTIATAIGEYTAGTPATKLIKILSKDTVERNIMTPEQALQILRQALVTKAGLTVDDCAAVVQAWNVIAEAVKPGQAQK